MPRGPSTRLTYRHSDPFPICQEFVLRFLRGDFRQVDRQRGRFRSFVKTVLLNLVRDYRRRQEVQSRLSSPDLLEQTVADAEAAEHDGVFLECWRAELLSRAWDRLAHAQKHSTQPVYAALRCKVDHPDLTSEELADQLTRQLGKPISPAGLRQVLHRGRKLFADLLLDDLIHSLDNPTPEQIEEELLDLGLFTYCQPALERRNQDT